MSRGIFISVFAILFLVGLLPACQTTPEVKVTAKIEKQQAKEPVFKVISIGTKPDTIFEGDNLMITALISSENNVSGEYSAILKLDNVIKDERIIWVTENVSSEAVFYVPTTDIGEHEISIGDQTMKIKIIGFDTKNPVIIQYDNVGEGKPNYLYNGLYFREPILTWFTAPTYPFKITSISTSAGVTVKGNYSVENKFITINIWDKSTGDQIYSEQYPMQIFDHKSPGWHDLQTPGIVVEDDFYIEVVPSPEEYPLMVIDFEEVQPSKRSFSSWGSDKLPIPADYNWYIRVNGYSPRQ